MLIVFGFVSLLCDGNAVFLILHSFIPHFLHNMDPYTLHIRHDLLYAKLTHNVTFTEIF